MTNAEKFKEVFGVEVYGGFCPNIEREQCIMHDSCLDCPSYEWTEQEYTGKDVMNSDKR